MNRSERNWSSAAPAASAGLPASRGRAYGERFGRTERTDAWWLAPLAQAIGLAVFGAYATWAALQGNHYEFGNYLSPFYSPVFKPKWWPLSSALLILGIPIGFRTTCYYYRKAYYRVFFLDPAACAVGEPRKGYSGETRFPFILQNAHRWFLYLALIFILILWATSRARTSSTGGSGSGSARWSRPSRSRCSRATRSRATRCVTSSAGRWTASRARSRADRASACGVGSRS